MIGLVSSEWIKYRRTVTPWLIVCGPFVIALAEMIFNFLLPGGIKWGYILMNVHNWWSTTALPFGITLLVALAVSYERRSGAWKVLNAYPQKPGKLYAAKLATLAIHVLLAGALFAAFILILNFWAGLGPVPWGNLASGFLVAWLAGLGQMAIMMWLAHVFGFGLTITVGFIGIISGVIMADGSFWRINPWAWPIRALEPIFRFRANGMPLEPSSPLLDPVHITVAIMLGIITAIVFAVLGTLWFNGREVR
ncbi:lantibiotic immunity ABC transporter MutE/EpiE family permease subunit [Paenibacillus zanthoxyli]|uniref:lantibiotic immunity ABC transporter MutE/EpiE family permease subunit n=1 Tax=Paenibacillus zanthoxyli TaxID=369399 RepID=UPI000470A647|nr:lantibiotic immunity ABC transporter MutE/EpiE family permease subunit [Paenibacillus zanthoxyli]